MQAVRQVPSAIKTAGTGGHGFNNDFGPASGVELNAPSTNLFDAQGNQYISDAGSNCVRRVDLAGSVTTIVGLDQAGPGDTCNASLIPTPPRLRVCFLPVVSRSMRAALFMSLTPVTIAFADWLAEPLA